MLMRVSEPQPRCAFENFVVFGIYVEFGFLSVFFCGAFKKVGDIGVFVAAVDSGHK